MQFFDRGKPPVGVVFSTAMGSGIDDALALAILHALEGKNEARLAAIAVSRPNLHAAAVCDVIRSFYLSANTGPFAGFLRGLPIGLTGAGKLRDDTPMIAAVLASHKTNVQKLTDTAEVAPLIRNALTAQYDQNALVVATGPLTDLARTLELHDMKPIIQQKVRLLAIAAGPRESTTGADVAAARKVMAEWPTPIVTAGAEIGDALLYPGASIEKDFAWSPSHPLVEAYRAYRQMPYNAPTYAITPVIFAVREKEGYFKLSEPGTMTVADDGSTKLVPGAGGKHRSLVLDPDQKERILKAYVELASAKPVERRPRVSKKQDAKK
jgi:purine nucleosidase